MGVLLVGGARDGEVLEDPGASMIRERGHDGRVGSVCEGYGPMDHYGVFDPQKRWPRHVPDTDTAKVAVAFSLDSPWLSTLESMVINKRPDLDAQGAAIVASFEKWAARS